MAQFPEPPSHHPGYIGMFHNTDCASATMKIGDRCQKRNSEPGDTFPDGTQGTILGSVDGHDIGPLYFYYVEFDPKPGYAVAILNERVEPLDV
jgi:hypothetical protein